jgi:hypothetical protein
MCQTRGVMFPKSCFASQVRNCITGFTGLHFVHRIPEKLEDLSLSPQVRVRSLVEDLCSRAFQIRGKQSHTVRPEVLRVADYAKWTTG